MIRLGRPPLAVQRFLGGLAGGKLLLAPPARRGSVPTASRAAHPHKPACRTIAPPSPPPTTTARPTRRLAPRRRPFVGLLPEHAAGPRDGSIVPSIPAAADLRAAGRIQSAPTRPRSTWPSGPKISLPHRARAAASISGNRSTSCAGPVGIQQARSQLGQLAGDQALAAGHSAQEPMTRIAGDYDRGPGIRGRGDDTLRARIPKSLIPAYLDSRASRRPNSSRL